MKTPTLKTGDRVHVPGRFRNLTVNGEAPAAGQVRAVFESGFGWVDLPAHEFTAQRCRGCVHFFDKLTDVAPGRGYCPPNKRDMRPGDGRACTAWTSRDPGAWKGKP